MQKIKFFCVLLLCSIQVAFAQKAIKFNEIVKDQNGNTNLVVLSKESKLTDDYKSITQLFTQVSGNNHNITFKELRSYGDNLDYTHHVYQAYYDGLQIKGMDFNVHTKNSLIQFANGNFFNIGDLKKTSKITVSESIQNAKTAFNISLKNVAITNAEFKELLFMKSANKKDSDYTLAYKIFINASDVTLSQFIYISALDGTVLGEELLVCNNYFGVINNPPNAIGVAQTRYSGTQNITSDLFNGSYRLREVRNNVNILTLNALNQNDETAFPATAVDFVDNNNNWQAVEHGIDQSAHDAHWGAEKVLDYWSIVHNRNSIDGSGLQIRSFVHTKNCYDNAFWLGTKNGTVFNSMFYGDGCTIFRPLTSLDICAHELGHGICQFTSNLDYIAGSESQALNEGLVIFGEHVLNFGQRLLNKDGR